MVVDFWYFKVLIVCFVVFVPFPKFFLSIFLPVSFLYLPAYFSSICLSHSHLSVCLILIYLPVSLSSICLSHSRLSFCLFAAYLSAFSLFLICLSVGLSFYSILPLSQSICRFIFLSVSIYLSVHLSICVSLSVCLFFYLSFISPPPKCRYHSCWRGRGGGWLGPKISKSHSRKLGNHRNYFRTIGRYDDTRYIKIKISCCCAG